MTEWRKSIYHEGFGGWRRTGGRPMTAAKKTKSKSTPTPRPQRLLENRRMANQFGMAMPESLDKSWRPERLERKMDNPEGPFPGRYILHDAFIHTCGKLSTTIIRSDTSKPFDKSKPIGASMCSFGVMAYYIDKVSARNCLYQVTQQWPKKRSLNALTL